MIRLGMILAAAAAAAAAVAVSAAGGKAHAKMAMQTFPVLAGGAHDVYPAPDGTVWFTAQSAGKLGRLDPRTSKSDLIALGPGAAPHGVIVGPTVPPGSPKADRTASMAASSPRQARWRCSDAPRGSGPFGIATTPDGQVFFASLAGNYLGQIDLKTGTVMVLEPPVPRQGARRVWSDSRGALWITGAEQRRSLPLRQ
jgi:virginiamycin B lyase